MGLVFWCPGSCLVFIIFLFSSRIVWNLYSDVKTEKKKVMDVARLLVRTDSFDTVNSILKVKINDVVFDIMVVEDWCGPIKWSIPVASQALESSSTMRARRMMIVGQSSQRRKCRLRKRRSTFLGRVCIIMIILMPLTILMKTIRCLSHVV